MEQCNPILYKNISSNNNYFHFHFRFVNVYLYRNSNELLYAAFILKWFFLRSLEILFSFFLLFLLKTLYAFYVVGLVFMLLYCNLSIAHHIVLHRFVCIVDFEFLIVFFYYSLFIHMENTNIKKSLFPCIIKHSTDWISFHFSSIACRRDVYIHLFYGLFIKQCTAKFSTIYFKR